jgi:hypothetical protein
MVAAFVAYFCVYGFRKPFTAGTYDTDGVWGLGFKEFIVLTQVAGYTLSKFAGIRVIAEMPPRRRIAALLGLVALAEAGLVAFGLLPRPWAALGLFVNGLALGMAFGLIFGFLEGRRSTEALAAGMCTSFIIADGTMKTVGAWLLERGVTEAWMPAVAGGLFAGPLAVAVAVLARTPPPCADDQEARSVRETVNRRDRQALFGRYATGLSLIVVVYLVVTVLRSVRADFAPQLWAGLGVDVPPRLYTITEFWVALGVIVVNGLSVLVRGNRQALLASFGVCLAGAMLLAAALVGRMLGLVSPVPFMVLVGLALYIPYVSIHTTVFERFFAVTRERGNVGYLLSVADSIGYLGYVVVLCLRLFGVGAVGNHLGFFITLCWIAVVVLTGSLVWAMAYFIRRTRSDTPKGRAVPTVHGDSVETTSP